MPPFAVALDHGTLCRLVPDQLPEQVPSPLSSFLALLTTGGLAPNATQPPTRPAIARDGLSTQLNMTA